jgi:WD40 repeat protein
VLYGSIAKEAKLFDLTDGRCLLTVPAQLERPTEAVGLSPDAKILATKDNKFIHFWDAATGHSQGGLDYSLGLDDFRPITNWISFTPDGKHVALASSVKALALVEVTSCKVTRTFVTDAPPNACVFSPDGKLMATAGREREDGRGEYLARLWDVETGMERGRFKAGLFQAGADYQRALAFSPDGRVLASGGWGDARLHLWDVATGKELNEFSKIEDEIRSIAFTPDGKTVAVAADQIYLYDPATGKERLRIETQAWALSFNSDGSILTGAVRGAIYRWDTANGRLLNPSIAQDNAIEQIVVGADDRVFTTDQEGFLYAWELAGTKSPRCIAGDVERGVVASPDGRFLAWAAKGEFGGTQIRLYDVRAEQFIDRFFVFGSWSSLAAFLPDGKTLVTLGGRPPTVRLWDLESGTERSSFDVVRPIYGLNDYPSTRFKENRRVPSQLWDLATGKAPKRQLGEPLNVELDLSEEFAPSMDGAAFYSTRHAAISPDGKTLAVGPHRIAF